MIFHIANEIDDDASVNSNEDNPDEDVFDPVEFDYHYDEAGSDNEYPENAPMDTPVWRNQVVENHRQGRTRAISSTE